MTGDALDVAVVGMAIRCPGARTTAEFWANLAAGVESIDRFTADEVELPERLRALGAGAPHVPAGGLLPGADHFDADFFGLSAREARATDPQQRQFLEVALEAFESAGILPGADVATAVFAGASFPTYLLFQLWDAADILAVGQYAVVVGNDKDHIATRTSNALDLRGPAMTVQSACSTSLVAVHLACQSLLSGETDLALAGASSVLFPERRGYFHIEDGILSPDGHCRPFDAAASGTVPGSGVGAVLLRRLSDAVREGDPIRAVIRATAVNNDGSGKMSYAAPAVHGQAEVITEALRLAGLRPADVSYVEAHGTGTPLGDPIEVAALTQAMPWTGGADDRCWIGSVKSNIGHLDVAAGVAGLIKTVLALENELIPPTVHFDQPNPRLALAGSRFRVAAAPTPWPRTRPPRVAGVSSFGIGGTNAHLIVSESPAAQRADDRPARPSLVTQVPLLLTAGDPEGLDVFASRLAEHLDSKHADRFGSTSLHDVARTLASARRHRPYRRAVTARTVEGAVAALREPAGHVRARPDVRVALLFSGAGSPAGSVLADVLHLPEAARTYREVAAAFDAIGTVLPAPDQLADPPVGEVERPTLALPVLFALQVTLARLWRSWGVTPSIVTGHSVGEYAAAELAGVLSLPDAAAMVATRARLLEEAAGGMVTVPLAEVEAEAVAERFGLAVAAVNAPESCVLSGADERALAAFVAYAEEQGLQARRLRVATGAHSSRLRATATELVGFAGSVRLNPAGLRYVSATTGRVVEPDEPTRPEYWGRHLCERVRFADAVAAVAAEADVLLEIGPSGTVVPYARACPTVAPETVIASLPHRTDPAGAVEHLGRAATELWKHGCAISWPALLGAPDTRVALPPTPFRATGHLARPRTGDGRTSVAPGAGGAQVYLPSWHRDDAAALRRPTVSGRWLVLDDGSALSRAVIEGIERAGGRVDLLTPADARACAGATGVGEIERVLAGRVRPDHAGALYCWSAAGPALRAPAASPASPDAIAFTVPFVLARLLAEGGVPRRLVAVTCNMLGVLGDEPVDPLDALVLGPVLVAGREHPSMTTRVVDVADPDDPALAPMVLAELGATDPDEVVAYRGRHRWLRSWLPGTQPERQPDDPGTALVVGGLGGLGTAIARDLVRSGTRRLALVGRSGLPPRDEWPALLRERPSTALGRAVATVEDLRRDGADVLVLAADITDAAAMTAAVGTVARELGPITTMVQAAGVPGGGLMSLRSLSDCADVLAPKVVGTRVLAASLAGQPLRQVLLCSALDAVLGTTGQVDHVAANAFLDAVPRAGWFGDAAVVSVNWGAWRDVGQAADLAGMGGLTRWRTRMLEGAIDPDRGAEIAGRLLGATVRNVAVSAHDVAGLLRQARTADLVELLDEDDGRPATRAAADTLCARPLAPDTYVAPEGPVASAVAAIWSDLLGIAPIGAQDNYFALGGHSVLAMQLVARLRALFAFRIPLSGIVERPTVAAQAAWLEQELDTYIGSLSDQEVDRHLDRLGSLTDDQATQGVHAND